MSQLTLFQQGTDNGPSQKFGALVAQGLGSELGDGIRSSYAILSIKAGRWRIKYKGTETPLMALNPSTGRQEPIPTLDMVIVKANGFLNKQFYAGKYVEGSTAPPDCYSLDGKVPSAAVAHPVHSNCATCPKNQWGSLIGDNGVKQKACRDTKKLAVVPLSNIRNAELGGAMLFRVPPSSLKDLSSLADAMKARGYPYNSIAIRFGFDMDVSHPKPTFQGFRALTDEEADLVLEMYESDSVAAVLADNDIVVEHTVAAPQGPGSFIQEPVVGLGGAPATPAQATQGYQAPQPQYQAPQPQYQQPAQQPQQAPEQPTKFVFAAPPPPPPGMHPGFVQGVTAAPVAGVEPPPPPLPPGFASFNVAPPAPQAPPSIIDPAAMAPQGQPQFAQPLAQVPGAVAPTPGKARVRQRQPVVPSATAAPGMVAQAAPVQQPVFAPPADAAPAQSGLDADIGNILKGLSAFQPGNG